MCAFDSLHVDHVGFSVGDLAAATEEFTGRYGFTVHSRSVDSAGGGARTVALGTRNIRFVLTEAKNLDHATAAYVERHGDGVSDIAFSTPDAAAAYTEAVRRGARPVAAPVERDGVVTASIAAFGDVVHTFVGRPSPAEPWSLPGLRPAPASGCADTGTGLDRVDHFAVCLEAGHLKTAVEFYETVLDFEMVFTERIIVGGQAMDSMVVQSRSGGVTLTLIEPDESLAAGQIDQFLKDHGGAGVQHIAFATDDIVRDVGRLGDRGVAFLDTPGTYYDLVPQRLELRRHGLDDLRRLNILADQDQDGQLLQIFTRSTHPRGTLFFEVIERLGARTFGSGNIKALYSAVELQQAKDAEQK
uniref:4-hydroxyphenylpyruvate dioxygenase n=1 Tax=Streptomyces violaceusniger TaxID=68280 RepID=A0A6F8Z1S8_STRVO|nr:4-hydroxyphenylpyruvate dioxygenase [Streptomyces violaceusniger]